jgi:type II secretory pathway predicted ATPase ExeA
VPTLNSNSSNRRKVYKLARIFNNSKIQNRNDAKMFVDKSDVSGRCDWSASFEQLRLTANGKPGSGKRVRDRLTESENEDNWCRTKKTRTWGAKI